jgi:hypothetical protein
VTYLIVLLENQVFNGGFDQYFANCYGQFALDTVAALNSINAPQKSELLKRAYEIVNVENWTSDAFRNKLIEGEMMSLFDDDLMAKLDLLDDEYYRAENEDLLVLLNKYLIKQ